MLGRAIERPCPSTQSPQQRLTLAASAQHGSVADALKMMAVLRRGIEAERIQLDAGAGGDVTHVAFNTLDRQ